MDIFDVLCPQALYAFTGRFFKRGEIVTDAPTSGGTLFTYEQLDPKSKGYQMVFGHIDASGASMTAIKTKKRLSYEVCDVVVLQDGTAYSIDSVSLDYGAKKDKQAFRLFSTPAGVDYVLRLKEIENPWSV